MLLDAVSTMRVFLVLAALVLAATTPAQAEDVEPLALARTVTDGLVRVVVSIDEPPTETILPVCESHTQDPEPDTTLVGTISDNCFSPLGGCSIIIVGINPHTVPPEVAAGPDWMCIEDRIEEIIEQSNEINTVFPVHVEV